MSVASEQAGGVRSLPSPVIDPEDLQALIPSLSPEDAALYCSLATLALEAVFWPNAIPSPLPPPVQAVGLAVATRLAYAGEGAGEGGGGAVVSESIGAYTYRLASPGTLDGALRLTDDERDLLRPWIGQADAYSVATPSGYPALPWDWFQRDLDQPWDGYLTGIVGPPGPPGPPGPAGPSGGALVGFEYQFSSTTTEPPTGSQVRLDNADASLATKLWARNMTTPGADVHALLVALDVDSAIYVQDFDDHSRFLRFRLSGEPIDKTDYVELPVEWISSGAPLTTQKIGLVVVGPEVATIGTAIE
jgi:hypothetical protein